jgi:hypothetical protein
MSYTNDIKPSASSYTADTEPSSIAEYLATEALDYLMTEDGDYLVTNQSNIWSGFIKPTTVWVNMSI